MTPKELIAHGIYGDDYGHVDQTSTITLSYAIKALQELLDKCGDLPLYVSAQSDDPFELSQEIKRGFRRIQFVAPTTFKGDNIERGAFIVISEKYEHP